MNYLRTKVLPEQETRTALLNHALALGLFGFMIVFEMATEATVSPLVSMICFGIFAHRMRPVTVACWVLVFSLTTLLFLTQPWDASMPGQHSTGFIRFWTVMVGGVGAVILSCDRNRLAEGFLHTIRILEKLPAPVIVSDAEGSVVFMNDDALKLLDTTADAVRGASYFSFVASEEKGRTIQKYFELVDSPQSALFDVVLQIRKPKPVTTEATLVVIKGGKTKLVATVFAIPAKNGADSVATPQSQVAPGH